MTTWKISKEIKVHNWVDEMTASTLISYIHADKTRRREMRPNDFLGSEIWGE